MVTAFVLINLDSKKFRDTADTLLNIPGVHEVHVVAGEHDMVAVVRAPSNQELSRVLTEELIHAPGVHRTKTLISLNSYTTEPLNQLLDPGN